MSHKRIHLIRHGQTDWNREKRVQGRSESTLTPEGRAQAESLRPLLQAWSFGQIHSSSSERTRQTAELLFPEHTGRIQYCDRLREIFLGPWEGRLHTEVREQDPEMFEAFWHRPDRFSLAGAETFEQVQQRAVNRFREIVEAEPTGDIAIVSHGVWIKTLLCHLESRPLGRLWEPPLMHNCAHSIVEIPAAGKAGIILYAGQEMERAES